MVKAVFPTPPSPSTTILCGVVNLPAIVRIEEEGAGQLWPLSIALRSRCGTLLGGGGREAAAEGGGSEFNRERDQC